MRSYPLHEARADLSKLIERALAGEPQRVTRSGTDAVVIVSETDWTRRLHRERDGSGPQDNAHRTLADILAAISGVEGFADIMSDADPCWTAARPLGSDLLVDAEDL